MLTITPVRLLAVIALLCAALSPFLPWPLLVLAVILLAVVHLL